MSDEQKLWTFKDHADKVKLDLVLNEEDPEEKFVTYEELIGYFNDGIDDAEAEITNLHEDYFLTSDYVPLQVGVSEYPMPKNIFANKLRGVVYANGSIIYPVKKFRMRNKFELIAVSNQFGQNEWYRHNLTNDAPGQRRFVIYPPSRETAVLPPLSSPFTPMQRWYIRQANRIPLPGEYTNPENLLPAAVNTGTDILSLAPLVPYVTGDQVKLKANSGGLPAPLVENIVYYAIRVSDNQIKLASSLANAKAGTSIDLTTPGTGFHTLRVAATTAIIDATIIDIPEFAAFLQQYVKVQILDKDVGDPRFTKAVVQLKQQREQMIDTLTNMEPDNDDEVEPDLSHYDEMS